MFGPVGSQGCGVFHLPGIFILFAYGAVMTMQSKKKASLVIHGGLLCVLLLHPLKTAAHSLTHIPEDTREFILELLGRDGIPLKQLKEGGSALYLYDLSAKSGLLPI